MLPVSITTQTKAIIAGLILLFVAASSSWVTWKVGEATLERERAEHKQYILDQQQEHMRKMQENDERMQAAADSYSKSSQKLSNKVAKLLSEKRRQEKPLPADCVLDADGMHYLESARAAAISATGQ